jgi:hypothetical protein
MPAGPIVCRTDKCYAPPSTTNKSDRLSTPDLLLPFESPHNRTITWTSVAAD